MQFEETVFIHCKKILYEVFEPPGLDEKNTTFFDYCQHRVYESL